MLKTVTNWIISFVHIQLIITLFSLPILILWGLPISLASLLGNFIFSPLLFVFIMLSCIITLCAVLNIPYHFFVICLEKVSTVWYSLLSYGSPFWLTGCSIRTLPVVLICCALFYIAHKKNKTKQLQIGISFLMLLFIFFTNYVTKKNISFSCDHTHILHLDNKTYCIDNGTFSRKRSAQSWIDYTLLPSLIYYTGSPHIDYFMSFKNNKRTQQAFRKIQKQTGANQLKHQSLYQK